jgi:hypothetical protein
MRVASFANVAPLHIYHLKNGQVQKAVDFASRSTWGRVSLKVALVLRTHGYMPIGVLIWFAIWSVGSSYYDTRGWTTGYYGKRRLAGGSQYWQGSISYFASCAMLFWQRTARLAGVACSQWWQSCLFRTSFSSYVP